MKKIHIKFFKKKQSFRKKSSEINPDFYWRIMLYGALVLMLSGAVFGYYLFTRVNKDAVASQGITARDAGTVKKDRLDSALKYFSDRKAKSNNTINSASGVVDPSL